MISKNILLDNELCLSKFGINAGQSVADLGCGRSGHFVFPLAELVGEKGMVYAVDVVSGVVEEIRKRAREERKSQVRGIWGNIEGRNSIGMDAGIVDLVIVVNTMHQLVYHIEAIREANRILKSRGRLMIIDWRKIANGFGPVLDQRLDQEAVINLAYRAGLDFTEEFRPGEFHYGLIFNKA